MTKKKNRFEEEQLYVKMGICSIVLMFITGFAGVWMVDHHTSLPEKPSFNNSYDSFSYDLGSLIVAFVVAAPIAGFLLIVAKMVDGAFWILRKITIK